MFLTIIPRTKYWRFYLYFEINRSGIYFGFYYKGDEVLFPLSLIKWLKGKRFFSISFCNWYPSLKAIQKEWEYYSKLCKRGESQICLTKK